jgi:hypothetical protein
MKPEQRSNMASFGNDPVSVTGERRGERLRVQIGLSVEAGDVDADARQDLVVHDLSRDGFRADALLGCGVGDTLVVTIPGGTPATFRIVRAEGALIGCEFLSPLSERQFERLRADSKVIWPEFAASPVPSGPSMRAQPAVAQPSISPDGESVPDTTPRWPLPVRAGIAVGGSVLLWALIAMIVL